MFNINGTFFSYSIYSNDIFNKFMYNNKIINIIEVSSTRQNISINKTIHAM
jgi:hypothetical protein